MQDAPYDDAYFAKYAGYAQTELGRQINAARVAFVARHFSVGRLVDVGIGCGQFVESWPGAVGYDVNPCGIDWLRERARFVDPYSTSVAAACFWDSLEHIVDPAPILENVSDRVFVALPIFRDLQHALSSKHFRRDEHCWYFTEPGFLKFMDAHGWECIDRSAVETELGRDDILSFAFSRIEV